MEQYLLTSRNFIGSKRQAKGSFELFQRIKKISKFSNVFIEAEIPAIELNLYWEECHRPMNSNAAFLPLISPKLYAYPFQYFGNFENDQTPVIFGNQAEYKFCEKFSARLNNEAVFSFEDKDSSLCNLSWLIDFLLNSEKISTDYSRNEKLIWQQSAKGYELVLESISSDKKISERQLFLFKNNFESVSWQHLVNIR
jgi:hypothetical protein